MPQFEPIEGVYPSSAFSDGYYCESDYEPLLDSFGYEKLLQVDDDDYQGDSRVLFRDGDRFGILIFGWGSCSGCDALQACTSYSDVENLRSELHSDIIWGNLTETLTYLKEHDWEGDFCCYASETKRFVQQAIELLEKE